MARRFLVVLVSCCVLFGGVASAEACTRQSSSVYVVLSSAKYPETTDHILDAQRAGTRRCCTSTARTRTCIAPVARRLPDASRGSTATSIRRRCRARAAPGADIRYVTPSDNRGAGATMGNALEPYCEDQPFRFRIVSG